MNLGLIIRMRKLWVKLFYFDMDKSSDFPIEVEVYVLFGDASE